jgi:hypothetical protein
MPDRDTWLFVNSFAPWLAALGTLAAVAVSLYLAFRGERLRLRVRSGIYHMAAPGQRISEAPEYFQVQATNHGFRATQVQGLMWRFGLIRTRNFVVVPSVNPYSTELPAKLDHGDTARFFFTLEEFKRGSDELVKILKASWLPSVTARRLRVGVYTTTGDEILAVPDKTVRDLMLQMAKDAG